MRAPASAAPIAALIAECSDSTLTISVLRLPVRDELREGLDDRRLRRDRVDGHDVGVDLAHRVRDRLAAGEEPDVGHSGTIAIAVDGADLGADPAALAVVEVEARERLPVERDRGVGAVEPAEQAVHAQRQVDGRLLARAPAAGRGPGRVGRAARRRRRAASPRRSVQPCVSLRERAAHVVGGDLAAERLDRRVLQVGRAAARRAPPRPRRA